MATFANAEAAQFWRYISGSLERLIAIIEQEPDEVIRYRPPAPEANSILGLVRHTLANAGDNFLGVLQGTPTERDRETEFEDLERQALLDQWEGLRAEFESALAALPSGALDTSVQHDGAAKFLPARCSSSSPATPPNISVRPNLPATLPGNRESAIVNDLVFVITNPRC